MIVLPIRTHKITTEDSLFDILDKYLEKFEERSVLVITSKIISITENRVQKVDKADKDALIEQESDLYFADFKPYGKTLTIKDNILIPDAGIDESNSDGYDVLWPSDAQKSANEVRKYLLKKFGLKEVGVIITDSKTTPLRWGTTGIGIAHSGFIALNDYIGTKDIFGREMIATKSNVMDGLAAAGVLLMGEGSEQTPLAVIRDIPFVKFQDRDPNQEEIDDISISIEDDIYAPIIENSHWKSKK